jgi:hypothetical protein
MAGCHCCEGWICETHPHHPWPHDDCGGPGMRCPNPNCLWWQGQKPAALDTSDWTLRASSASRPHDGKKPH